MRIASLMLGITASLLGVLAWLIGTTAGLVGAANGTSDLAKAAWLMPLMIGVCLLGLVASGLAMATPRLAGLLLLACGVAFLVLWIPVGIVPAPVFGVAALFALVASFSGRRRVETA
jgi:hypothetical protein